MISALSTFLKFPKRLLKSDYTSKQCESKQHANITHSYNVMFALIFMKDTN